MEQTVRVIKTFDDGMAQVSAVRQSACSGDCHKCSGCGAVKQTMQFTAVNAIGASVGDWVTVRSDSRSVLAAAAILYIVPLLLFFAGYVIGMTWNLGGPFGCLGFVLGLLGVIAYERLVARKQNTVYTITGYAYTKGDHELD